MTVLNKILDEVDSVVKNVKEYEIDDIVDYIDKSRKIFVCGEGRSGLVGKCFAMRLMHIGYKVYVIGETTTPSINEKDILFAISGSGETSLVLNIVNKSLANGTSIIGVTSKKESSLAKASLKTLIVPGTVKSDSTSDSKSIQLLSSLFDQSVHIVLDCLCLKLSYKDRLDNKTAIKNHSNLE